MHDQTAAFALYIEILKSMSPKENKFPDHLYNYELIKVPRTAEERERILRGDYTGIDFVTYDDIAVRVLNDQTGDIDRKLGDRPGYKLVANKAVGNGNLEMCGYYIATLEDAASWPIGPHGWEEPPEDFKHRTIIEYKAGKVLDDYARNFLQ